MIGLLTDTFNASYCGSGLILELQLTRLLVPVPGAVPSNLVVVLTWTDCPGDCYEQPQRQGDDDGVHGELGHDVGMMERVGPITPPLISTLSPYTNLK